MYLVILFHFFYVSGMYIWDSVSVKCVFIHKKSCNRVLIFEWIVEFRWSFIFNLCCFVITSFSSIKYMRGFMLGCSSFGNSPSSITFSYLVFALVNFLSSTIYLDLVVFLPLVSFCFERLLNYCRLNTSLWSLWKIWNTIQTSFQ